MSRSVWIEWIDSAQCHGWEPIDGIIASIRDTECKICVSMGFVIHESDISITVTSTKSSKPDQASGAITIPKVAIKCTYEIKFAGEL